ncbi:MAG: DNA mismatch repair endonuclease MutL [Anaerovoracaceae bacterium]|jgi:DNA mismatch repair protein MutL
MADDTRHIKELTKQTADRIAAGEVVERPVSIVKELVENSIDAGSTSIVVEIKDGGKSYIRVTDNGCGIRADETELAFKRHATSKISEVSDLDSISTLGFRGEALASIAAVSRTELTTKTADERAGSYLMMEGGNVSEKSERGCPEGTTVIVRDLFYNTPARRKFLKGANAESALVTDFVSKTALSHPDIRVRMINNGSTLFSTPGRGGIFTAIATVYDRHLAGNLIEGHADSGSGLSLDSYLSSPDNTRKNRRGQIFFVNGRWIKSRLLEECVSEAYKERMFEGRYPVAFLFLNVDPAFVDVNIHPNKMEVRFDDDRVVREFVTEALRESLRTRGAIPEVKSEYLKKGAESVNKRAGTKTDEEKSGEKDSGSSVAGRINKAAEQIDIRKMLKAKRAEEDKFHYSSGKHSGGAGGSHGNAGSFYGNAGGSGEGASDNSEAAAGSKTPAGRGTNGTSFGNGNADRADAGTSVSAEEQRSGIGSVKYDTEKDGFDFFAFDREERTAAPFDISSIEPAGVVFDEYILGSDADTFYIIDQHAAHERIFYEKLTDIYYRQQKTSQIIAIPITVEATFSSSGIEDEWLDLLRKTGFAIEEFGPKTYICREIPSYMTLEEAQSFLQDFTDETEKSGSAMTPVKRKKIVTRACKSAVKAHDHLTEEEVAGLLKELSKCRNPFSCPHGRPTVIRMSHDEIDRMFKRRG